MALEVILAKLFDCWNGICL